MSDKKHIDRIFQEKMKDFEVSPSPKVWENIQSTLESQKEPQNKSYPIWFRFARIAAVLLLLLTIGGVIYNSFNSPTETKIVDTKNTSPSKINNNEQPNVVDNEDANATNADLNESQPNELPNAELDSNTVIANASDGEDNTSRSEISNKKDNPSNANNTSKDNSRIVNANNATNTEVSPAEISRTPLSSVKNKDGLVSRDPSENKNEINPTNDDSNSDGLNTSKDNLNSDSNVPLNSSRNLVSNNKEDVNNNVSNSNTNELNTTKDVLNSDAVVANSIPDKQPNTSSVTSEINANENTSTKNKDDIASNSNRNNSVNPNEDTNANANPVNNTLGVTQSSDKTGIAAVEDSRKNNSDTTGELDMKKANDIVDEMKENNGLVTNEEDQENKEDITKKDSTSIEDAIAQAENIIEEEEKVNRWQVYTNVAPVYYNTLGKGSHIHEQFVNNPKSGEVNTSYGVNVGYALNDKLSVRTGFHSLNLSYDTNNVILYENVSSEPTTNSLRNISFVPSANNANVSFSVLSADNLGAQQLSALGENFNAAISQRISYFEVPLELQYRVIDKKLGVNIIGGVSTFILDDNEVFSEFDNRKTLIGEANNITDVSFSTNLGLGIDYKFSKKLKLNLEPTFKYQLNAYKETSGNFRPYIIGVYTGLSYKF